jgi:hypothetical protein
MFMNDLTATQQLIYRPRHGRSDIFELPHLGITHAPYQIQQGLPRIGGRAHRGVRCER